MKRILLTFAGLAVLGASSFAEELSTTYFLDNNVYSYRFNPAIAGDQSFAAIAIGNINTAVSSNIGVNSLIFKKPDGSGFVTGLNSSITSEQFLGKLKDHNNISENLSYNLFAFGFRTGKAFHSIELNLKEDLSGTINKDLFDVLKNGTRSTPFDLTGMGINANAYMELAYGYSRKIGDKLSVGGRAKFLIGMARAEASFDNSSLIFTGDQIGYNVNGDLRLAGQFLSIGNRQSDYDPDKQVVDLGQAQLVGVNPSGFGGAVDLGATYEPVKNLVISLSVLNLGGIAWKYNVVGKSVGQDTYTGVGIDVNKIGQSEIQTEFEKMLENLNKMIDFERQPDETKFRMLATSINLGARYYMPFYDRLSVGALFSYKFDKYNPYLDFRGGATITPVDWFSLTGSLGVNSFCSSFGVMGSFNLGPFNLITGVESYFGKLGKINVANTYVPIPLGSFSELFKFGITITFGERQTQFSTLTKGFRNKKKE